MSKRKAPSSSSHAKKAKTGKNARTSIKSSGGGGRAKPQDFDLRDEEIDEELASDQEEGPLGKEDEGEDEEKKETAEEKRIRMAKSYLMNVEETLKTQEEDESSDEGEMDTLGMRLEEERLRSKGMLSSVFADRLIGKNVDPSRIKTFKYHDLTVTSVCLTTDERAVYSGSKDNSIVRWDVETGERKVLVPFWKNGGHQKRHAHGGEVFTLAVSTDGRYLAAGGRSKEIQVWDTRSDTLVKTFSGHRDTVSSLCFRTDSHTLYSGAFDRTLKHWDLNQMAYIETLYGHQSEILAIDAWRKEKAITCGRDRTVRLWKIAEESHLVYKGHKGLSIDCVALLSDESWITGGDDGCLALWHINKKKPQAVVKEAHGPESPWICSVAAVKGSDVVASGSSDGYIRLWKVGGGLTPAMQIPMTGFVNSIQIAPSGKFLVAGVGQEHKLGRWSRVKAKNRVCIVPLPQQEAHPEEGDAEGEEE